MQYPQLPVAAFITAALVLVPLPWHWRARNVATISIMAWLFVVDFIYGVNAILWSGNVINHAPVWCDITTKIVVGASFALPLSTLCVCKHLEMVSSTRKVSFDSRDRRRRMIFESIMCFGIPIIFMILHYVVQGHRFDIVENIGCQATVYISIPAIMLIWFPQLFFSVLTLVYAAVALYHFIQRRITFAAHLQNSNSALTTNRYLRLIAMACTEMIWGTVFTSLNLWNNVYPGIRPWTNWADVHSNFSRVDIFPTVEIPPVFFTRMLLFWWTTPASSIIFFAFFGFGEEAKKEYSRLWAWAKKIVFRRSVKAQGYTTSFPSSRTNLRSAPTQTSTFQTIELGPPLTNDKKAFLSRSSSPHPSTYTMTTTTHVPTKSNMSSFDVSSLSCYDQFSETIHTPSTASHPASSRPPSPPPFPAPALPYVEHRIYNPSHTSEIYPVPEYPRPFSPPSVLPALTPGVPSQEGVHVTIHKEASVEHIV